MSNRDELRDIISGFLLIFGCHILAIFVVPLIFGVILIPLMPPALANQIVVIWGYIFSGFGLTQLLYVIPLVISFASKRRPGIVKAIIIATLLTMLLLLYGACFYVFRGL